MSERSTVGPFAASFCAIALASRFSAPARNEGFAYETPFSRLQSLATRPVYEATIIARKKMTIARHAMPTGSWRSRRHASIQRPGDSWGRAVEGFFRTALI